MRKRATDKVGVPDLHLHDLRHTGGTYAADTGASTRELMQRLGHSSARAALIYQHARDERDEAIASGLDELIEAQRRKAAKTEPESGDDGDDPPLVGARPGA